ncbi:autotransporter [Bartonella australis AUST/NH1]|uniref:Autotransporter n=1 Tax=Bartonella australis (strain Aust/NH1) TaxID=1094489 RepID=M1PE50_BARAA|nr:autotransporter outer membrane beta-barrel domain-containing protein [Bartonella australis]AGF74891.1 autotransporter [Bartonella australis AUST/NH1]
MIPIVRSHVYLCAFTTFLFSFLPNVSANVNDGPSQCNGHGVPCMCDDGKMHMLESGSYQLKSTNSEDADPPVAIAAAREGTVIHATNIEVIGTVNLAEDSSASKDPRYMYIDDDLLVSKDYGVFVSENGKVILNNSTFKDMAVGFIAYGGTVEVNGGALEAKVGVLAREREEEASVILNDVKIKIDNHQPQLTDYLSAAARVTEGASLKMTGGAVDVVNADVFHASYGGAIVLDGTAVTLNNTQRVENNAGKYNYAVFNVSNGGDLHFENGSVDAFNSHGLLIESPVIRGVDFSSNRVNIENSIITVKGHEAHGIYLFQEEAGASSESKQEEIAHGAEVISLRRRASLIVPDNVAIYSNGADAYIGLSQGASVSGNLLVQAEEGSSIFIQATASSLKGGSRVVEEADVHLYLSDGSTWTLTQKKRRGSQIQDSAPDLSDLSSSISLVSLSDSSIIFEKPTSAGYQTLSVGTGIGEVYTTNDNARLYFNIGGLLGDQRSDQLLINGDVSGTTTIYVRATPEGSQRNMKDDENNEGIPIIQVFGKAKEDSFILGSGYTTLNGLPYQYRLHAYGLKIYIEKAYIEAADGDQQLSANARNLYEDEFWDVRLEHEYVEPAPGSPNFLSDQQVKVVVPQVPTYLLLPNALFQVGLMDVSNQNRQIEAMGTAFRGFLDKRQAPFARAYGGQYGYASNLSNMEYGYGANLSYNALEAGISLKAVESEHASLFFGATGTYGKFSLQPKDVEESKKSKFEKWSAAVYGSLQHNTGFYVNGLLSYGLFEGDVSTDARGKTASIKGKPLSASLTSGKAFAVESGGLVFDPQVQLIYQRIFFDKARDIDNFDIDIGQPEQWTMRVGGRLSKRLKFAEKARSASLYGKAYFSNSFKDRQFASFGDDFQLGALGSSLEAGAGVHAQLSSKLALYGDLSYQHRLTSAGFSGMNFSGGLRYHF